MKANIQVEHINLHATRFVFIIYFLLFLFIE